MRYELPDGKRAAIKPMLPNKPRGVPRVNDRRVLNGIFGILRSETPLRDLPAAFAPAIELSGSSTGSSNLVGSRRVTTNLPPTTSPSSNSLQSGYGSALMSPRPNTTLAESICASVFQ